jgi:predicted PurR-regulated permease PerM
MSWTKILVIGLAIVSLLIIWSTRGIWCAAFLGLLFAVSLGGLTDWLRRKTGFPHWLATTVALLIVLGILASVGWGVGSPLASQVDEMSEKLPDATQKALVWLDNRRWGRNLVRQLVDLSGLSQSGSQQSGSVSGYSLGGNTSNQDGDGSSSDTQDGSKQTDVSNDPQDGEANSDSEVIKYDESIGGSEAGDKGGGAGGGGASGQNYLQIFKYLAGMLSVTLEAGMLVMVAVVVMLFVAFDPGIYKRGALWLVPMRHEGTANELIDHLRIAMRWWMLGRLVSMVAVGVLTFVGMWAIGMPAPLALGAIAGLLSFVPNIGPIVAAIPGILLALGNGPWMAVWAVGIYVAAQFIESNAITPIVDRYAVAVPPALVLVSQLVFAMLAGVWGMIISTPFLVVVMVLVQTLYVNRRLNKSIEVTGEQ